MSVSGVHHSSLDNWFNSHPNFRQAIEAIRRERKRHLAGLSIIFWRLRAVLR